MTLNERMLFHQIHPAKLVTDASAAVLCLYFLWQHDLSLAIVVAMVPPLIASGLVLRFVDLEALKQSALGVYVHRYMTPAMQLLRVCGFLVMAVAAWNHAPLAILAGLAVVAAGWLKGVIVPRCTDGGLRGHQSSTMGVNVRLSGRPAPCRLWTNLWAKQVAART
jgi:hypothetical protein